MDFYRALAARNGVRHLAFGGDIASPIVSGLAGGLGAGMADYYSGLGGGISNAWKQAANPNHFVPNVPVNTYQPNMPMNDFRAAVPTIDYQATAPDITHTNFQPSMDAGMAGYGQGMQGLAQAAGNLNNTAAGAAGSITGLQNLYGQQQGLADALLAQSRGQGPNPAQEQFRQNSNQNIAQQASAIASTRGINPALAARMASQQGAAMQQQAAGQSAILGAQQQLAAQQALGVQQGAMAGNLAGQNNVYATIGGLYGRAGDAAGTAGGLGGQLYGTAVQGQGAQNQVITQGSLGSQGINADIAKAGAANVMEGQRIDAGVAAGNQGAGVVGQQIGRDVAEGNRQSDVAGQQMIGGAAGSNAATQTQLLGGLLNGAGAVAGKAMAHGGMVHDQRALSLAHALMGRGGEVPGRAKVSGDSASNDVVPTVLSPDEIVLPRSVATAEDAPEKAAEFVAELKGKSSGGAKGYGKVLEKHRMVQKHMADLEALIKGAS